MNRHLLSGWLLFIVLVPVVAAAFGCGVPGERAESGCPADEVCSDATPDGLVFHGTPVSGTLVGGTSIAPVALGGTQRIRIRTVGGGPLPTFDAQSSSSSVEIGDVVGDQIELLGVAPGTSTLRVLERPGGGLLDRTTVATARVDRAVVAATSDHLMALAPERRPTRFVPGTHALAVHLLDASGRIVVDESMTIDAGVPATTDRWDTISLDVPADGLELSVSTGGSTFAAPVELAGAIDDVELATWILVEDDAGRPEVSRGGFVCALALSEGAWVATVVGTPSRFVLDGAALEADATFGRHCAVVSADAPEGAAELTIEIGEASRTFAVQVVDDGSTSSALVASRIDLHARAHALGERARHALSR